MACTRSALDLLVAEKKMSRDDAYILCSLAADPHVTQAVDATKGRARLAGEVVFQIVAFLPASSRLTSRLRGIS